MDLNSGEEFDIFDDNEGSDGFWSESDEFDSDVSGGFGNFRDEGSDGLRSGIQRCFSAAAGPSSNSDEFDSAVSGGFGDFRDESSNGLRSGIQRCCLAAAGPSSTSDKIDSNSSKLSDSNRDLDDAPLDASSSNGDSDCNDSWDGGGKGSASKVNCHDGDSKSGVGSFTPLNIQKHQHFGEDLSGFTDTSNCSYGIVSDFCSKSALKTPSIGKKKVFYVENSNYLKAICINRRHALEMSGPVTFIESSQLCKFAQCCMEALPFSATCLTTCLGCLE